MGLRPYQTEFLSDLRKALADGHRRVLMVASCGSGKTVVFSEISRLAKEKGNECYVLVHRRELLKQAERYGNKVFMAQSLASAITRGKPIPKEPSILICDEAHHASANTYAKIFQAYPNAILIGFTATPQRTDGKALGDVFDCLVETISAEELMEQGYLCRYDYYAPRTSIEGERWEVKGSDYDQAKVGERMATSRIYGDIAEYLDPKRKTIIYCPSVAFSKSLEGRFPFVRHIDGDTPTAERDLIISQFRDGAVSALTNVDLIGEGFDVPDCDCVILLRPTMSLTVYIQQSMRCLRPSEGKRATIYDMVGNAYRHGLPTDRHEWSLKGKAKCRNPSAEKDIVVRECKHCFRVYQGTHTICPYCGYDNGKTRRQIEIEEKAKLERIEALRKMDEQAEQSRCRSFPALVNLAKRRGYKNPSWWASKIMMARRKGG